MQKNGKLIVLSGPSGSGKGALRQALSEFRSDYVFSVSATTRAPRKGEVDGKDYYFVDENEFEEMIKNNDLLEWARVYSYYYGTPVQVVEKAIDDGYNVILEIDVQGALQVKEKYSKAVLIFIIPPTPEKLRNRLEKRNTETEEELNTRLNWAKKEVMLLEKYDYVVVNDQVSTAAQKLNSIIEAEDCRPWLQSLDSKWFE